MSNLKTFILVFIAILLVYICGLPIDIMEVDAAQYATISYEMFESGSYLQLYCRGYDYLDKPPFLFWINQVFFSIFGVHDWSFKLGNLLFILLGIYSTYQLGKLLYNKNAGLFSACILGSTQAWFLITHDVKTDGILASAIIFTVWQWKCFSINKKWSCLLGMSAGIAIGMLTKGPLGLIVPGMIMCVDLAGNRQWKMIFNWKYILSAMFILLALSPMLYGLYLQYDLHPGKTVSGGHVVDSGLRFYFWTQSFGRITGENKWHNNDSFFYFLPEIAWAFLPWTIFVIQSLIMAFRSHFKKNLIPLAGFILPYIALSFSSFKLSHYIFICFPFIALMVGNYLSGKKPELLSKILAYAVQFLLAGAILFLGYCFNVPWIFTLLLVSILLIVFMIIQKTSAAKVFLTTLMMGVGMNLFLNLFIYPALLNYQASSMAGKEYLKEEPDKKAPLIEVNTWSFSMEFYAKKSVKNYGSLEHCMEVEKGSFCWLYMNRKTYDEFRQMNIPVLKEKEFDQFPATRLKPGFIWPETRQNYISKTYLVKVYLP